MFDVELPVNAWKSKLVVDQPDLENVQLGRRDSSKSYTPQIRYTKLEFKVIFFHFLHSLIFKGMLLLLTVLICYSVCESLHMPIRLDIFLLTDIRLFIHL